jgi:hypothetical protein
VSTKSARPSVSRFFDQENRIRDSKPIYPTTEFCPIQSPVPNLK